MNIYRASMILSVMVAMVLVSTACQSGGSDRSETASTNEPAASGENGDSAESQPAPAAATKGQPLAAPVPDGREVATFAGGCFWCMEGPFEKLDGVDEVLSGYTGGLEKNPTYKQVSSGSTGHTEAVRVIYDPGKVEYKKLVDVFWRSMDPTDAGGQFADRGSQYRPAIFFHDDAQKQIAEASKKALAESERFDKPIVVPIQPAQDFYVAEDYHQDYYKTNSTHYNAYRRGSGRAGFLEKTWGDD